MRLKNETFVDDATMPGAFDRSELWNDSAEYLRPTKLTVPERMTRSMSEPPIPPTEVSSQPSSSGCHLVASLRELRGRIAFYRRTTECLLDVCEDILQDRAKEESSSRLWKAFLGTDAAKVDEWLSGVSGLFHQLASEGEIETVKRWKALWNRLEDISQSCPKRTSARPRIPTKHSISPGDPQVKHRIAGIDIVMATDLFELAEVCIPGLLLPDSQYKSLLNARGADARAIANLLHEVSSLSQDRRFRRRVERALRKLCGRAGTLPSAFYLNKDVLKRTSASAVACGGFADIWEGKFEGRKVAMKVLRVYGGDKASKTRESFYKEVVFWKNLLHPNIVPFLGLADPALLPLCMVSEWMPYGNLLSYLKIFPRANRVNLISDIIAGLYYLHHRGIVHGDIKGGNVLIDAKFRARLADFGLARVTQEPTTMSLMQTSSAAYGSLRWMAPELLQPQQDLRAPKLSAETDIYALGMVMLEAFTGRVPFHDQAYDAMVIVSVIRGVRPKRPEDARSSGLSDPVWLLMTECWNLDARHRPLMEQTRHRFEDERARFEPPKVGTPEECDEVEDMLALNGDDEVSLFDDDEAFFSDADDSFMQQDLTRDAEDTRFPHSSSSTVKMRDFLGTANITHHGQSRQFRFSDEQTGMHGNEWRHGSPVAQSTVPSSGLFVSGSLWEGSQAMLDGRPWSINSMHFDSGSADTSRQLPLPPPAQTQHKHRHMDVPKTSVSKSLREMHAWERRERRNLDAKNELAEERLRNRDQGHRISAPAPYNQLPYVAHTQNESQSKPLRGGGLFQLDTQEAANGPRERATMSLSQPSTLRLPSLEVIQRRLLKGLLKEDSTTSRFEAEHGLTGAVDKRKAGLFWDNTLAGEDHHYPSSDQAGSYREPPLLSEPVTQKYRFGDVNASDADDFEAATSSGGLEDLDELSRQIENL